MGMTRRRLTVIVSGAAVVMLAGSITAFAVWSSGHPRKLALHPAATASPVASASFDLNNPFGVVPADSPRPSATSPEATTSPTGLAAYPSPSRQPGTPNPNQAMLGSDADGRPILASIEVVPGGDTMALTTTWKWDGSRWKAVRSDRQFDSGGGLIYDPYLGKVVALAGGITGIPYTMWGLDANGWGNLYPETVPARGIDIALMALDQANRQLVALVPEGSGKSSTWTFEATAWALVETAITPPPRRRAGMAYDPASSTVILYGGDPVGGGFDPLDDTWTWDGRTWTQRHPATTPGGCSGALSYDAATSQMVLFCQRQQAPGSRNFAVTMWTWTGTTWTQLHPRTMPPAEGWPSMTYDAVGRDLVLFGAPVIVGGSAQTWTYANGQWKQAS
jgi:hypothetical protein